MRREQRRSLDARIAEERDFLALRWRCALAARIEPAFAIIIEPAEIRFAAGEEKRRIAAEPQAHDPDAGRVGIEAKRRVRQHRVERRAQIVFPPLERTLAPPAAS